MSDRTVLITGATGKQGGATVRALQGRGFRLLAMTRKPEGDAARTLKADGVEVIQADFDDEASLKRAMAGVWGLFAVQNTWEAGVEREEAQGKRLARVARAGGVEHYVYASVGSAHRKTGIPHFENKWRIEETVRSLRFPSYVIVRPVFFMENLTTPWFLNGDAIHAALKTSTVLQMIAVDDIGKYHARAFIDSAKLNGREIDIAGDARTMPEVATVLGDAMGRTLRFVQVAIEEVRKSSEDYGTMLAWFDRVGYNADITGLEREFGVRPTKLDAWAAAHVK
jgi:uncharacterized protein YbjT (DUF2867 family)